MQEIENRKFPRIPHWATREIFHFDLQNIPSVDQVVLEDLSAAGLRFSTPNLIKKGEVFLVPVHDRLMKDIDSLFSFSKELVALQDDYLAEVVWSKSFDSGLYQVGARFVKRDLSDATSLEKFTELLNRKTFSQIH